MQRPHPRGMTAQAWLVLVGQFLLLAVRLGKSGAGLLQHRIDAVAAPVARGRLVVTAKHFDARLQRGVHARGSLL